MSDHDRVLKLDESDHIKKLREKGFEPGTTLFTSRPAFTIEDMKASAFDTRYSNPKTIPVKLEHGIAVQVAVTVARTVFATNKMGDDHLDQPTVYFEYPDWYLEGWIVEEGSSYGDQKRRVRAYVYSSGLDDRDILVDEVIAQVIPTSSRD